MRQSSSARLTTLAAISFAFVLVVLLFIPPQFPANDAQAQEGPRYGGVYRRGLSHDPSTLDPATLNDIYGRGMAQQIFDGLVTFDGSLGIRPAIAESWKRSPDGLTWTFYLRRGVKFHNAREVTADDFVYSFTRLLDPNVRSSAAELFLPIQGAPEYVTGRAQTVKGLRAVGRYTLEIKLSEPSPPFVSVLAIGYAKVVPREAVEQHGKSFGLNPVGTGPFKLVRWIRDKEIVLEANNDYFLKRPYLDRIHYKIFPGKSIEEMFREFEQGNLEDSLIPADVRPRVKQQKQYQFIRRPVLALRFLGINNATPPLNNSLVRKAISYALNKNILVHGVYGDRYEIAMGILPPGTYGHNPAIKGYPYNPQIAKRLLKQAGYPVGKDLPLLEIWSSVRFGDIERENAHIVEQLAAVGIKAKFIYNTKWPSFKSDVYGGKLPIFRYAWYADVPEPETFLYNLFHSKSPQNFMRYKNPKVDALLQRARIELDYLKRVSLYREVEQLIMNDAALVPLSFKSYERVFQSYVRNLNVSALGDPYIAVNKLWLDDTSKTSSSR